MVMQYRTFYLDQDRSPYRRTIPGCGLPEATLVQTNGASIVVAESGSTTRGFDTLISQNNFKSDNTPQPTRSIDATFANEDGDEIIVDTEELTIE